MPVSDWEASPSVTQPRKSAIGGGYETFAEQSAGILKLKAGTQTLLMRPDGALKQGLADIQAVKLRRK